MSAAGGLRSGRAPPGGLFIACSGCYARPRKGTASPNRHGGAGGECVSRFPIREYAAGENIFSEGQPGAAAYLVTSGKVRLSRTIDGAAVVIDMLAPGDFFGQTGAFDASPLLMTASAMTEVTAVEFPRAAMAACLHETPLFFQKFHADVGRRLREATERALALPDLFEAVIRLLDALYCHDAAEMDLEQAMGLFEDSLNNPRQNIDKIVKLLEQAGLLGLRQRDGRTVIDIPDKGTFLERSEKLRGSLHSFLHDELNFLFH